MRLSIRNIGKVSSADIELDGLTVLASPNNTGKSTIGKAIFAGIETFCDLNGNHGAGHDEYGDMTGGELTPSRVDRYLDGVFHGQATGLFVDSPRNAVIEITDDDHELMSRLRFEEGRCIEATHIEYGSKRHEDEDGHEGQNSHGGGDNHEDQKGHSDFNDDDARNNHDEQHEQNGRNDRQIERRSIGEQDEQDTRDEQTVLSEQLGRCAPKRRRRVLILDDPQIVEKFSNNTSAVDNRGEKETGYRKRLLELVAMHSERQADEMPDRQALEPILEVFDAVCPVTIEFDGRSKPVISRGAGTSQQIRLENTSMGVKAFTLLRYLIENGIIRRDDVLVLDEPEIHLHPQWQVSYAKALSRIAHQLGVRILVTTHSPFFLKALIGYSQVEHIETDTHYYTCEDNPLGSVDFREIHSDGLAKLYADMAKALTWVDSDVLARR